MAEESGSVSYPGSYQNSTQDTENFYKNLAAIIQEAGWLEFFNSKGSEQVNLVHKNGTAIQLTTKQFGILATKLFTGQFLGDVSMQLNGNMTIHLDKDLDFVHLGDRLSKCGDVDKWQPEVEEIKKKLLPLSQKKQLFEVQRTKNHNEIDQAKDQKKSGSLAECPIEKVEIKILKTDSPMEWTAPSYSSCSRTLGELTDNEDIYDTFAGSGGKAPDDGWECLTCYGTEESPSTQDGKWDSEPAKKKIADEMVNLTKPLAEHEKQLGQNKHRDGGNDINKVSGDKVEVVGLAFNDFPAHRVDPHGKLIPHNLVVDPFGSSVYKTYKNAPLLEKVHIDDLPGGNYTLQVNNRYNLMVGAGGISLKTAGHFEVFGSSARVLSESISMHSRLGTDITSNDHVRVEAPNIVLKPIITEREIEDASGNIRDLPANGKNKTEKEGQVLVEGGLGVEKNLIVKGGTHIEGELSVHHITAPCEYQITEEDFEFGSSTNCASLIEGEGDCEEPVMGPTYADIVGGCLIGYAIGTDSNGDTHVLEVISVCAESSVLVHPHYHRFKNLPLKLVRDEITLERTYGDKTDTKDIKPHDAIRAIGSRNNSVKPVLAKPVKNSKSNNTVLEKFGGSLCDDLVIDNADWEETCEEDSLPEGMGVSTKETSDEKRKKEIEDLEKEMGQKVKEFSDKLNNISEKRKDHEELYKGHIS